MIDEAQEEIGESAEILQPAQEKELTTFEEVNEFQSLLLGNNFFPGGLARFERKVQNENPKQNVSDPIEEDERITSARAEADLRKMTGILDAYQEQNYLLDPFLERIVEPPVYALQKLVLNAYKSSVEVKKLLETSAEMQRLARLLYHYTKVRGYKTILHFFPHSVDDLLPTLTILEESMELGINSTWEVRYILILWLSLICMIPFDLGKFDYTTSESTSTSTEKSNTSKTMTRIENVGKHYLNNPGKERDAASVLLGKLFQRRDVDRNEFLGFLQWSRSSVLPPSKPSTFLATGILQTWCYIIKLSTPESLMPNIDAVRSLLALYSSDLDEAAEASGGSECVMARSLVNNSIVNKYKAKMACRLGLKALKPRKRAKVFGATLLVDQMGKEDSAKMEDPDEDDIPEEIDRYIALLIDALQDKDTIVRYSAAKGISRLCSRLPDLFIDQIADEITSLFAVNVANLMSKKEDLSNVSEFTWQGCCIALAELARRASLPANTLGEKMPWIERALLFDIRRGAHSVGSGVRDTACYALWALARAHDAEAIRPFAKSISEKLVCVSLLDREISIRRAASAAFQECVGRLNLFAHGIDVIRKTDFYAVGIRKNAFLNCLPQVAEHKEYRTAIIQHLLDITLVHWDPLMRELGSQALASVVRLDPDSMLVTIVERLFEMCHVRDVFSIHGALLSLAEISRDCLDFTSSSAQLCRLKAFSVLKTVVKPGLRSPGSSIILRAACQLIANSVSIQALEQHKDCWQLFVDMAMERQEEECHSEAAKAIAAVSSLQDQTSRIRTSIQHWRRLNVTQSQSNARVLGSYNYANYGEALQEVIIFLIGLVKEKSPTKSANIETRRNAYQSLSEIFVNFKGEWYQILKPNTVQDIWQCLLGGLDDYSTDARGDVGSWIRIVCMQGLHRLFQIVVTSPAQESEYLPQELFENIFAGLAKQMIERIDSVRTEARQDFLGIIRIIQCLPSTDSAKLRIPGEGKVEALFKPEDDELLRKPTYLYDRIVPLLEIFALRKQVLEGIVLGMGAQRETINRDLAKSLTRYLKESQESRAKYGQANMIGDLQALAYANLRSNRLFVPCLQTCNVLFEESVIGEEVSDIEATEMKNLLRILDMATRSVDKVKSIPRLLASVQLATNMMCIPNLHGLLLDRIKDFLLHPFPIIRSSSAELLYVQLQNYFDEVTPDAEDTLLSTEWSQTSISALQPIVNDLLTQLKPKLQ